MYVNIHHSKLHYRRCVIGSTTFGLQGLVLEVAEPDVVQDIELRNMSGTIDRQLQRREA